MVARAVNTINSKWSREHQWQVCLQITGIHDIQTLIAAEIF
jgi:hypothetical protein